MKIGERDKTMLYYNKNGFRLDNLHSLPEDSVSYTRQKQVKYLNVLQ